MKEEDTDLTGVLAGLPGTDHALRDGEWILQLAGGLLDDGHRDLHQLVRAAAAAGVEGSPAGHRAVALALERAGQVKDRPEREAAPAAPARAAPRPTQTRSSPAGPPAPTARCRFQTASAWRSSHERSALSHRQPGQQMYCPKVFKKLEKKLI